MAFNLNKIKDELRNIIFGIDSDSPRIAPINIDRFPSSSKDFRVKISDPSGRISNSAGALAPLQQTSGKVVFPYTPEISINHTANYTPLSPTHSNYEYLFYQSSAVSEINLVAQFSARSPEDADYVLAVQHFFRSATKMFYGQDQLAGVPPVVCRLEGHGALQLNSVPIVITSFNSSLPSDVDYISATDDRHGRVPTVQSFNITAKPLYSRDRLTNEFNLSDFASGSLLNQQQNSNNGGFI
jgi:hypothetical protein